MQPTPHTQRSTQIEFTCPCGTTFPATLHQTVNVTLEPELLYRLLAGTLNVITCPNCGRRAASAQPFIYHDMRRGLFAYVHPRGDVDDEEREHLLETLRKVYTHAVQESERMSLPGAGAAGTTGTTGGAQPRVRRRSPGEDLAAQLEPDAPPMQVIFGTEDLVALVESLLEPDERLGRIALGAHTDGEAERARLLGIARTMAGQMGCYVDVDDTPGEYTVYLFGPRARIVTLARALGQEA